jgi:Tfp pilus assembly protein PilO
MIGYRGERAEHERSVAIKRARLEAIVNESSPFRGLGADILQTRNSIAQFYSERLPAGYSQIVGSLGDIAIRSGVSLSQVSYTQGTPGSDMAEVSIEVSVSGNYSQLLRFVNGIERDRNFFIVRALSFTGQQSGDVNLHVRISTWLRSGSAIDALTSPARVIPSTAPLSAPRPGDR